MLKSPDRRGCCSVEVSSEQVEMKGYPRILLKTKANELYGLGYPAILLKADQMSELSYDVIENIHGRDVLRPRAYGRRAAFTTSGEFAGNRHQGAREQARQAEPAEKKGENGRIKPLNDVESIS
jgi:hypothetical protein